MNRKALMLTLLIILVISCPNKGTGQAIGDGSEGQRFLFPMLMGGKTSREVTEVAVNPTTCAPTVLYHNTVNGTLWGRSSTTGLCVKLADSAGGITNSAGDMYVPYTRGASGNLLASPLRYDYAGVIPGTAGPNSFWLGAMMKARIFDSPNAVGVDVELYSNSGNAYGALFGYGVRQGTGNANVIAGIVGEAEQRSTGTAGLEAAFWADGNAKTGGAGNVALNAGFVSESMAGISNVVNAAFYSKAQGAGANDYGFYSAGSTTKNKLEGSLDVGTTLTKASVTVPSNSAGANVVPVSNGTNLVDGATLPSATLSNPTAIDIDSQGGVTTIGDIGNTASGTKLRVNDPLSRVEITQSLQLGGDLYPVSAASGQIGEATLPFSSVYVGNAANNSSKITGTFTGNRTLTLPDADVTIPSNFGSPLSCLVSNTALSAATGTVYSSPGYGGTPLAAATEAAVGWAAPRAGTVSALQVYSGTTAKVNTPATVITVRKNGVDTTLTLTMTQTVSTLSSDNTHTFTVARGDIITVSFTTTGAAAVSTSIAGTSFLLN